MAPIMSESARQRLGIPAPKVTRYVAPPKVDVPAPKAKRAGKPVDPRKGKVDSCGNRCTPLPLSERVRAGKMPRSFRDLPSTMPDLSTPSGVRAKAFGWSLGTDVFQRTDDKSSAPAPILTEL